MSKENEEAIVLIRMIVTLQNLMIAGSSRPKINIVNPARYRHKRLFKFLFLFLFGNPSDALNEQVVSEMDGPSRGVKSDKLNWLPNESELIMALRDRSTKPNIILYSVVANLFCQTLFKIGLK